MKPLSKAERASMPLEWHEAVLAIVVVVAVSTVGFAAIRDISEWFLARNWLHAVIALWLACGALVLYVFAGWLKREGA